MKGIIYKDYLLTLLPKNIFSILSNFLVMLPIIYFFPNFYGLALTCVLLLPMSGTNLLQMSMEQDELSKFDKLQLTFPMTKKDIILSKYIGGLMFIAFWAIVSLVIALFYYGVYQITDLATCLQLWAAGIVAGTIFMAFAYTGFYLLGNKKGTIVYFLLAAVSVIVYLVGYFGFDALAIVNMNYNVLLIIGFAIAAALLVLSYYISLKIYTRRYS